MRALALAIIGISIWTTPGSAQQAGPDIFQIFDHFMVSSAVASKCAKPEQSKLNKFLVNYQIVLVSVIDRIKKISPSKNKEDIENFIKARQTEIDKNVKKLIENETCDGKTIKDILKTFDMHAEMNLLDKNPGQK